MSNVSFAKQLSSYGRLGLLLTFIGTVLAFDSLVNIEMHKFWPLLIFVLGVGFIGIYIRRSRREAMYIGIGTYLIGFSGLALYCNFTSWISLATFWPLFIGILGLSFTFGYFFGNRSPFLILSGLLALSLTIVFFFVFGLGQQLWWTVFVFSGISFLVFDKVRHA